MAWYSQYLVTVVFWAPYDCYSRRGHLHIPHLPPHTTPTPPHRAQAARRYRTRRLDTWFTATYRRLRLPRRLPASLPLPRFSPLAYRRMISRQLLYPYYLFYIFRLLWTTITDLWIDGYCLGWDEQ